MEVLVEGHRYELENFEDTDLSGQTIQFIQKEHVPGIGLETVRVKNGRTSW